MSLSGFKAHVASCRDAGKPPTCVLTRAEIPSAFCSAAPVNQALRNVLVELFPALTSAL